MCSLYVQKYLRGGIFANGAQYAKINPHEMPNNRSYAKILSTCESIFVIIFLSS